MDDVMILGVAVPFVMCAGCLFYAYDLLRNKRYIDTGWKVVHFQQWKASAVFRPILIFLVISISAPIGISNILLFQQKSQLKASVDRVQPER